MQEAKAEVAPAARARRTLLAALISATALMAAPASVHGAFDFGNNLGLPPTEEAFCVPDCTIWNTALHPANTPGSLTAPIDGVLVSFSLRHMAGPPGAAIKPIHLRVVEPLALVADASWRALGGSSPEVVPANSDAIETFPVRVPIKAGNYVGIEFYANPPGQVYAFANNIFGAAFAVHQPPLGLFGGVPSLPSYLGGRTVLLRASVEPDGDGDGYGDETQDQCPSNATTQKACPAKKCKKKKKGKRPTAGSAKKRKCKKRKKKGK